MNCPNCGAQNNDNANACFNCGAVLTPDQQQPVPEQPPVYQQTPEQPPVYQQTPEQPPVYQQAPVYQQPPVYQQAPAYQPQPEQAKSSGVPSLVPMIMGIVSFAAGGILPLAILALVFGIPIQKRAKAAGTSDTKAKLGVIFGILGIVECVLLIAFLVIYYVFIVGVAIFANM